MAKTVLTSATSYLPASEFVKRHDARVLGDLLQDADARVPAISLPTDPNLAEILLDASGAVESACLRGGRYIPADLAALTGAGLRFLYRIVDGVAFAMCWERRYPDRELPAWCKFSFDALDALSRGERILSFQEAADAGRLTHKVETQSDLEKRCGVAIQADRFFGIRSNRRSCG